MPLVALHTGDALATLRSFRAASVDLVVGSPPYEDARTYGIDFAHREDEWVRWAADRFMECLRVSRGIVAWVVAGRTQKFRWTATPPKLMVAIERRGGVLRNPCIFHRVGIPGSGGPDYFRADYEWIIVATNHRGRLPWSDNTACGHAPKWGPGGDMSNRLKSGARVNQWGHSIGSGATVQLKGGVIRSKGRRPSHQLQPIGGPGWGMPVGAAESDAKGTTAFGNRPSKTPPHANGRPKGVYFNGKGHPGSRLGTGQDLKGSIGSPMPIRANPGNVIKCLVGGGVMGDRYAHKNEAPFPEKLVERFVRSFCPPDGVVLDPFSGSGTTVKVAVMHGRNGVGIDIRDSQNDIAHERLKAWHAKNPAAGLVVRRIRHKETGE